MKGLEEFKNECLTSYPYEKCGLIYMKDNEWHIVAVETIPMDFDGDGFPEGFTPDRKDWAKKKKKILRDGGFIIGIIHSHPVALQEIHVGRKIASRRFLSDFYSHPSKVDLKYQRKFRHLVRGIVVCSNKEVFAVRFHDVNDVDVSADCCPICRKPLGETT